MKIHRLEKQQILPISLGEAWEFFSTPKNLNLLTPEDMSFEIISDVKDTTYAGQIIIYKIKPIFNISLKWVTEITQCVDRKYFIDEQRFGPYSFWHHQHHFEEIEGGIFMKGKVKPYHSWAISEIAGVLLYVLRTRKPVTRIISANSSAASGSSSTTITVFWFSVMNENSCPR